MNYTASLFIGIFTFIFANSLQANSNCLLDQPDSEVQAIIEKSETNKTAQQPNQEKGFDQFLKTMGAAKSPFMAYLKDNTWALPKVAFEEVFNGKREFTLPPGATFLKTPVSILNLNESPIATGNIGQSRRDKEIVRLLIDKIKNRKDDELLVIHTGIAHAIDLFFALEDSQRDAINFIQDPRRPSTELGTKLAREWDKRTFESASLSEHNNFINEIFFGLLTYHLNHDKNKINLSTIMSSNQAKPGVIVYMDLHFQSETKFADEFPASKDLSGAGFSKVILLKEGYHRDVNYELADLKIMFDYGTYLESEKPEEIDIEASSVAWERREQEEMKNKNTNYKVAAQRRNYLKKMAIEELKSGAVIASQATAALYKKIMQIQSSGFSFRMEGLEPYLLESNSSTLRRTVERLGKEEATKRLIEELKYYDDPATKNELPIIRAQVIAKKIQTLEK